MPVIDPKLCTVPVEQPAALETTRHPARIIEARKVTSCRPVGRLLRLFSNIRPSSGLVVAAADPNIYGPQAELQIRRYIYTEVLYLPICLMTC
jgi:hypothetical protein